ncbi:rCG52513 [Rattus norvegicus]|uniref:RCG52513 n=1 Tax=Rattus norvegicus TaxID=10116 RepID=A6K0P5_RAT|nr:rCG52513 [Rattus norvegicus]
MSGRCESATQQDGLSKESVQDTRPQPSAPSSSCHACLLPHFLAVIVMDSYLPGTNHRWG